jgi:hypothetical protein
MAEEEKKKGTLEKGAEKTGETVGKRGKDRGWWNKGIF